MTSKGLIKNVISSLLMRLVTLVYGFIVPILIIKNYGSNVNGLLSSVSQFLAYIVLLEAGIGPVIKNALFKPIVEKNKEQIEKILGATNKFFRNIAIIFILYIIVLSFIYPNFVNSYFSNFYTISIILIISISRFFEYFLGMTYKVFLQADGKNYIIDYVYIITYLIDIILIWILIQNNFSIHIVKLSCSLIYLFRPIILKIYFDKKYKLNVPKKSNFNLEKKWDALCHHIAHTVQENTDVIILTIFSTLSNVSVYSIYSLIIVGIRNIINSLTNGLDAFFGKLFVNDINEAVKTKFKNYMLVYYTIITILLSCTIVLIIPFVKLYTAGIHDVNYVNPLFAYILIVAEFNYVIRYPYASIVFAKGDFRETRNFSIIEPIVNIILSTILVMKYGLVGVAIGTLVSMLIRSFGFIIYATTKILKENVFNDFKMILISFIQILIVLFVNYYMININLNSYFQFLYIGFITFIIVTIAILAINFVVYRKQMMSLFGYFKKIVKKKEDEK